MPVSLIIFVCLFGFWFYAEYKLNAFIRVISGLVCMAFLVFQLFGVWFASGYESKFMKRSIQLADELLARGETQRVQQAFQVYNKVVTNSSYQAADRMLDVLTFSTNQPQSQP